MIALGNKTNVRLIKIKNNRVKKIYVFNKRNRNKLCYIDMNFIDIFVLQPGTISCRTTIQKGEQTKQN